MSEDVRQTSKDVRWTSGAQARATKNAGLSRLSACCWLVLIPASRGFADAPETCGFRARSPPLAPQWFVRCRYFPGCQRSCLLSHGSAPLQPVFAGMSAGLSRRPTCRFSRQVRFQLLRFLQQLGLTGTLMSFTNGHAAKNKAPLPFRQRPVAT